MTELPGINLDYRINKQLERMNLLRRAAVDQTLFGAVTTQSELAKQHKSSFPCTHCGDQDAASSPPETFEHRYWECLKWTPFRKNYPELTAAVPNLAAESKKFGLLREPKQVLDFMKFLDRVTPTKHKEREPCNVTIGTYATDAGAFFSSFSRWRHCTWVDVLDLYETSEAGLLPGLTQTINRARLTAALCALRRSYDAVIFTDSMYVVRGCERIDLSHQKRIAAGSLAARLTYATKRNCPNRHLCHMVEDIWKRRGNRIRIYKVASTHSFKDADKEAERPRAEVI